jgi:hypothetical protein
MTSGVELSEETGTSARRRLGSADRLKLGRSLSLALFLAAVLIVVYVVTLVSTPISVRSAQPHDHGLYMSLGRYLSQGHWLGPFNQFTLAKGPGYPLFLALANRLGISVSLAHALFHCAAVVFFAVIAERFVQSRWLSAPLFLMLLLHPVSFSLLVVQRDVIYYGQVLIFVAAFAYCLFIADATRAKLGFAAVSGAALGWFWLTREEGMWLVPTIALMATVAIIRAYQAGALRQAAASLMVAATVFAAIHLSFQTANFLAPFDFVWLGFLDTYRTLCFGPAARRSGG